MFEGVWLKQISIWEKNKQLATPFYITHIFPLSATLAQDPTDVVWVGAKENNIESLTVTE